ncbi:MAG TPA: RbsD/FucU domain-containing protein [Candidatus Limiplasma sp.]|nr:RbsD/FucU domain-containing protein [Candidatus Limiplasma sp.]
MLKGIPPILSPELLKILCEMGHGDTIVLADANFPAEHVGKNKRVLRYDGHSIPVLLKAVLSLLPLDTYVPQPVTLMRVDQDADDRIQFSYADILYKVDGLESTAIRQIDRFDFYKEAAGAYAIVATGEQAAYGNIILQKGVVPCS